MARFDLKKGDRFSLTKESGLNNLRVELGWKGTQKPNMDAADLDACAFLLGEDGVILEDADFVYYKSDNREEPFDRQKYGNKKNWRDSTRPMSADGSVLGSHDDLGDGGDDESEEGNEEMTVDLNKVNPKITEIVFCVTIYNEYTFGDVRDAYISVTDEDSGNELCRYALNEKFKSETAVIAGGLICDEEGEWAFEAQGKGYDGGMQTLIDIYA